MEEAGVVRETRSQTLTLVALVALCAALVVFGLAAPGTYAVYKMLHVLAAVLWVGGGAILAVLVLLTEREGDPKTLAWLGHKVDVLATRIFIPSALVVLVCGILMMAKGDLDWGQFWVIAGLLGFAATFLTGILFFTPQTKKMNALAAEHGFEHPLTQATLRRLLVVARFDIALLLAVVADMVAKPFS